MQLLAGLFLGAVFIIRLFPELPVARTMHRYLAELPAIWIEKADRRHLIYLLISIGIVLFAGELVAMVGSLDLVLAFGWDLSLYLDILMAISALTARARIRGSLQSIRASLSWKRVRPNVSFRLGRRARASRSRQSLRLQDNDDDEHAREVRIAA